MSDAKLENKDSAPDGTDGRMLSRARRQAMSRGGMAGIGQMPKAKPQMSGPKSMPAPKPEVRTAMPVVRTAVPTRLEPTAPANPTTGDGGFTHAAGQQTLEAVCALVEADPSSAPNVRQLCQERRRALSSRGKPAQGNSPMGQGGVRLNDNKTSAENGLSGRAAARARREELCRNGSGDDPACRPTGRVRTASAAPAKTEQGSTLRGSLITGTLVERSSKMTGVAGSCRAITGTEYIGAEQYGEFCATTPPPSPAKVGSSSTGHGQRVSGTELGRSTKVTGDEPGACLKLTGSQYYQPDLSGSVCQGSGVPHKVSVMSTVRERPVTGTDVAASTAVTGSDHGACSSVTGTGYAGLQQYQACNLEPVLTPEKVALSRTWRDQPVSGTALEHNPKVTGDEYGGCQPISGTEYIGSGQYAEFCATDRLSAARERVATPRGAAAASMTGVGRGVRNQGTEKKVTGSARGTAQRLSGTPYSDDAQPALSGAVGMSQHPLTRGPADRSKVAVASAAAPVQSDFSVMSPARTAQASQLNRVTGTAYGAQGRITGPVNLATGLVSGTPEFRYRPEFGNQEDSYAAAPAAKKPAQAIAPQANRVTGEGREAGFAITGAAWRRDGSTTGTEGVSAAGRNPTLRGDQRSMAMQLTAMKEREQLQVPPSKVTGSSGNTAAGSTITYSGGARG